MGVGTQQVTVQGAGGAQQGTERKRTRFDVDIPFTKQVDEQSGDLVLTGYASTWVLDRDGEYIDPRAFDDSLPAYLAKNPIVLWQHWQDYPMGVVRDAKADANGLAVEILIKKPKDNEDRWRHTSYELIAAGVVRTLSIGGFFYRDFAAGRIIVTEVELLEISVVSIPANPDSIFEAAVKSLHGVPPSTVLPTKAVQQMEQLLGLRAVTDPELLVLRSKGPEALEERYDLLCDIYRKARKLPPSRQVWEEAKAVTDPRERLTRVMDVMATVHGKVDAKQGRVLSKANEGKLRQAAELLQAVLAQVEAAPAVDDTGEEQHGAEGDGLGAAVLAASQRAPGAAGLQQGVVRKGTVTGKRTWPLADRGRAWDASAADTRIREKVGATDAPNAAYDRCCFYRTTASENFGDRHFLFCDVVDGEIRAVPRAIFACAAIMQGGRGGPPKDMPESDHAKVRAAIGRYYERMADEFDDPEITAPWE